MNGRHLLDGQVGGGSTCPEGSKSALAEAKAAPGRVDRSFKDLGPSPGGPVRPDLGSWLQGPEGRETQEGPFRVRKFRSGNGN